MHKVNGIGGLFFRSANPDLLAAWYENNLGVSSMASGTVWQQQAGATVFAPFARDTEYFGREAQQFMVNFRVDNLAAMLEQLAGNGVRIDEERMDDEIGKFAWIYDIDGNKIELWEPAADSK